MRNNSCRERVIMALERTPGVEQAEVSLIRGIAVVVHDGSCQTAVLIRAVAAAGYSARPAEDRDTRITPADQRSPP
ncbi:MAG: cation transporter [Phycisphaerales bacterium]|nr:cation transporter [Phycisphaerales bacterium]